MTFTTSDGATAAVEGPGGEMSMGGRGPAMTTARLAHGSDCAICSTVDQWVAAGNLSLRRRPATRRADDPELARRGDRPHRRHAVRPPGGSPDGPPTVGA